MEYLDRSGVTLSYEDVGKGLPAILLVHDLASDHLTFAPQIEYFGRKHRVVAVDLRGHGQSDKPIEAYTLRSFAEDLSWLCLELGVHKPIVVGHGLGGLIAIELAVCNPHLLTGIVALESKVLPYSVGSNIREEFLEATSNLPQHVAVSVWENSLSWDLADGIRRCSVPLLYLTAVVSGMVPVLFSQLGSRVMIGQTCGKGHFHQLEVPEQVNAAIEHFVAVAPGQTGAEISCANK